MSYTAPTFPVEYYVEHIMPAIEKIKAKANARKGNGTIIFETDQQLKADFYSKLSYILRSLMQEFTQKALDDGFTEYTANPQLAKLFKMYEKKYHKIVGIVNKNSRDNMILDSGFYQYLEQMYPEFAAYYKANGQQIITG